MTLCVLSVIMLEQWAVQSKEKLKFSQVIKNFSIFGKFYPNTFSIGPSITFNLPHPDDMYTREYTYGLDKLLFLISIPFYSEFMGCVVVAQT
jgi:hypothetical protein